MMDRIAELLSGTNTILFLLLFFKDMSGSSELRKIREQLEKLNEIKLKLGR